MNEDDNIIGQVLKDDHRSEDGEEAKGLRYFRKGSCAAGSDDEPSSGHRAEIDD